MSAGKALKRECESPFPDEPNRSGFEFWKWVVAVAVSVIF